VNGFPKLVFRFISALSAS